MAQFRYVAKSRTGERQEGALEASDKRAVLAQLGRLGFVPISVVETSAKAAPPAPDKSKGAARPAAKSPAAPPAAAKPAPAGSARKWFRFEKSIRSRSRMKMGDLPLFTGELSDLLASGMTLGSALHALASA